MNIKVRRICGTITAVVALAGAGICAVALPANAQPAMHPAEPAVAATTTAFDLNGIYSDLGSAVLRISDVNDILTIDMSSQHRPNANGVVVNSDTIIVAFPDAGTFGAKLVAPGMINWSNGSHWQKLAVVTVPDVVGKTKDPAVAALQSAGLTASAQNYPTCDTKPGVVDHQSPVAESQVPPGSLVKIFIAVKPKTACT
jgi:PASTA domain-containing protein